MCAYHVHSKSNGEIERVESSLVNDNEVVPVIKESASPHITGVKYECTSQERTCSSRHGLQAR